MKKLASSFVILALLIVQSSEAQAATPKSGAACTKAGLTQTYAGKKFTCIKSGKKLLWNSGIKINTSNSKSNLQNLDPNFKPEPLTPNKTSELSKTSPAPGRFCVNENSQSAYGNEYIVCTRGVWKRKLGYRIADISPKSNYATKLGGVSEKELEKSILSNWSTWKKKKLNADPKMKIVLQEGYSKDWEEVTKSAITYTSNVLEGNGLKLVQTPQFIFADTEDFRIKTFDEYAKTAPCHPPYIANAEEAIYCATFDMGSGGLRINKLGVAMTNNYRLTVNDKKLLTYFVAHDMGIFYEVQAQYGDVAYHGNKNQIPAWIREGTAQLIGHLITNDLFNSGKSYVDLSFNDQWIGPKPESICSKDLQDAEGKEKIMPDACSQSQHLYAVSLLAAKFGGLDAIFKFHKLYGQNDDWVNDFKTCFGISREDFYREWWSYLGIAQSSWPDIQPPTPPERY